MNPSEYINQRLKSQQQWYQERATSNKVSFMHFQTTVIILSSLIPFLVVMATFLKSVFPSLHFIEGANGVVTSLISACIAIITGIDKLKQPQTNWYNYRANEELLKKEEWMYLFSAGPYNGVSDKDKNIMLVERVESIISADIARLGKMNYSEKEELPEPGQESIEPQHPEE